MAEIHDDPLTEAAASAVRIAKEFADVILATQSLQLRLIGLKPDKDAPLPPEPENLPELGAPLDPRAGLAAARMTFEAALDQEYLATAPPVETARLWAAAQPLADHDPVAAQALANTEARLEQIHPEAMSHYRDLRASGLAPAEAMLQAAPKFDAPTEHGTRFTEVAVVPETASWRAARSAEALGLDDAPLASAAAKRHSGLERVSHGLPHRRGAGQSDTAGDTAADEVAAAAPTGGLFEFPDGVDPAAVQAVQSMALDDLDRAAAAETDPELAAREIVTEADLAQQPGAAQNLEYADALHTGPAAAAEPEAARAAELALRNAPTAEDAVHRMPRPQAPSSTSGPRKSLVKRLTRR